MTVSNNSYHRCIDDRFKKRTLADPIIEIRRDRTDNWHVLIANDRAAVFSRHDSNTSAKILRSGKIFF